MNADGLITRYDQDVRFSLHMYSQTEGNTPALNRKQITVSDADIVSLTDSTHQSPVFAVYYPTS